MNEIKLLDYPVWRLNFREYGELKGYDLSQTESACDWFDHDRIQDARDNARLDAQAEYERGEECVYCGKDSWTCEHHEEPNHECI